MRSQTLLSFILFLITLAACTLNSEQESSLNQHVSKYIQARNGCMIVGIVGFTHPEYVKELQDQGDSVLLKAMDCNKDYEKGIRYNDPTLRKVKKDKDKIHVYYELDIEKGRSGIIERRAEGLYAISEDNGRSWYFLTKDVYTDKNSCKSIPRLIEFE